MTYNFDRVSDQYDATRGLPPGVADQIAEWVLSRLPGDPAVAEVGVGSGRIAVPFIERGVSYTGFDISEQMVAVLQAKLGGDLRRARLILADITEPLPLAEASQDAVLAVHILHLVDPVKALAQIRRILKPDGALVWGYEWHDDEAPRTKLRSHLYRVAAELGAPVARDFLQPHARQLLYEWGTELTRNVVAVWKKKETPRQVLRALADRVWSSTWHIPEEILKASVLRTEAWARREYGDLDQPITVEDQFVVDWFQFKA